MNRIITK